MPSARKRATVGRMTLANSVRTVKRPGKSANKEDQGVTPLESGVDFIRKNTLSTLTFLCILCMAQLL